MNGQGPGDKYRYQIAKNHQHTVYELEMLGFKIWYYQKSRKQLYYGRFMSPPITVSCKGLWEEDALFSVHFKCQAGSARVNL